ncbi:MAG TPA: hypothetical protein VK742_06965 [Candidatus Sulfotelmatobacter sp.]|jgi:hypothetical protein|nr:hypothetical protein [Candidatus Sulfotelmatobacter sp.]
MKKTLLLLAALGLASAAKLTAGTVDVYITGSTAFRANVYTACTKLFASAPSIYYGNAAHGGAGTLNSKDTSWCMTGTPITQLTNVYTPGSPSGTTLNIHGLFTGSIQGLKAVETSQKLVWALPQGTINNNTTTTYTTNSATLAFSDSDNAACPYIVSGNYEQESVAVQPFVIAKANTANGVTNISNVSWEQMYYGIPNGRVPLSAWTSHDSDSNNWVYLAERTLDSGTRRTLTSGDFYQYSDTVGIYIYDATNGNGWYSPTQLAPAGLTVGTGLTYGDGTNGVIATGGYGFDGNVNLQWGYGYVAGGDIKDTLNKTGLDNQSLGCLSMSDSQGVGTSNWATVVSFDGLWPTVAGAGIHGNTGTNDYSPITSGYYPLWGYEVVVHPIDPGAVPPKDQNITLAQLGDWLTPGTFEGVFNAQTINNGGSPITGSIENEIQLSKTGSPGATAIRLSDMKSNRTSVGGEIFPF